MTTDVARDLYSGADWWLTHQRVDISVYD